MVSALIPEIGSSVVLCRVQMTKNRKGNLTNVALDWTRLSANRLAKTLPA